MAITIIGKGGIKSEVDTKHSAIRTSMRPLDHGSNGAFRLGALSGSIAATLAAGSLLFAFRWTDASKKCVLHELRMGVIVDGVITTSVLMDLEAVFLRSYTASHTGGSSLLSANAGKDRTTMAASLAEARMATTAALAGGTVTADTQNFAAVFGLSGTAINVPVPMQEVYKPKNEEHPIVFDQNEGFAIRSVLTGPATGTFRLGVIASWTEVATYDNALL